MNSVTISGPSSSRCFRTSRGVPRVNYRRVLNGIFWVLRSGAPRRDLPESYGPPTTCYNRFVRWRRAGVWDQIMEELAAVHDKAVPMIDTSIVRVHEHGACIAGNREQHMGGSRGGLTSKLHAVVDLMVYQSALGCRPARFMTTGYVQNFWPDCFQRRWCLQTVAMMQTGSGRSLTSKAHGPTSLQSAIAKTLSASVRTFTVLEIWSSGSSIRSSSVGGSRPVTTNSQPIVALPSEL